jgi:hypothetical protein
VRGEPLTALPEQPLARAGGHEHPDAAALFQQAVVGQQVEALGRGGRVDPVEGGQLVHGRHALALGQAAVRYLLGQPLRDLREQRRALVETSHIRHRTRLLQQHRLIT